jgi:hypothetical protein
MLKRSSEFPARFHECQLISEDEVCRVSVAEDDAGERVQIYDISFPPDTAAAVRVRLEYETSRDWRRSHQHALLFRRISNLTALVPESFARGQQERLSRNSSRLHNFQSPRR